MTTAVVRKAITYNQGTLNESTVPRVSVARHFSKPDIICSEPLESYIFNGGCIRNPGEGEHYSSRSYFFGKTAAILYYVRIREYYVYSHIADIQE